MLMTRYGCTTDTFAVLTNKIPHSVVVGCNKQAKIKNTDPTVRFHCFPEDPELYHAWVNAVKRTNLPKHPRLCSQRFKPSCFDDWYRLELVDGIKCQMDSPQT